MQQANYEREIQSHAGAIAALRAAEDKYSSAKAKAEAAEERAAQIAADLAMVRHLSVTNLLAQSTNDICNTRVCKCSTCASVQQTYASVLYLHSTRAQGCNMHVQVRNTCVLVFRARLNLAVATAVLRINVLDRYSVQS
jgi:multidrug resistance efflux pump